MLSIFKKHRLFMALTAVMLVFTVFFICVSYNTYISVSIDRRYMRMDNDASGVASDIRDLFLGASNFIDVAAFNVEYLINSGISDEELGRYLFDSVSVLRENSELSQVNMTAVFSGGLINDEAGILQTTDNLSQSYWYKQIKNASGEFVIVPLADSESNDIILAGKLLLNKRDALFLTIPVRVLKDILSSSYFKCALFDQNSAVITHTDNVIFGKAFLDDHLNLETDPFGGNDIIYDGQSAFNFKDVSYGWRLIAYDNLYDIYRNALFLQLRHLLIFILLYAACFIMYVSLYFRRRNKNKKGESSGAEFILGMISKDSPFTAKFIYFVYLTATICFILIPGSSDLPIGYKLPALAAAALMAIPTFKKEFPVRLQSFMITAAILFCVIAAGILQHNMLNIQDMLLAVICIISLYQSIRLNLFASGIITISYAYYWFYDKNILMGSLYDNNSFFIKIASLYIGMLFIIILIAWNKRITAIKEQDAAEAKNADSAKSAFLENISDKIGGGLNTVIENSGALLESSPQNSRAAAIAGKIHSTSEKLLGEIREISDFSKIENGHISIINSPYNIKNAINKAAQSAKAQIENKPVELIVETDPELPDMLVGDEERLMQILTRLLDNAVKFTDNGHILLKIIWDSDNEENGILKVWVLDTGIGIEEDNIPDLFSAFAKFDFEHNTEGAGLGLPICKTLLELMNGSIHVNSIPKKGSTFSFYLPQGIFKDDNLKTIRENI